MGAGLTPKPCRRLVLLVRLAAFQGSVKIDEVAKYIAVALPDGAVVHGTRLSYSQENNNRSKALASDVTDEEEAENRLTKNSLDF